MNLTLTRKKKTTNGIYGELTSVDGAFKVYTLEHSYDGEAKVPLGSYTCMRGIHHLTTKTIETFEITNVPGHSGILFHPGNTQMDSEGCVLLGDTLMPDGTGIGFSKRAFDKFIALLKGQDLFELLVTEDLS